MMGDESTTKEVNRILTKNIGGSIPCKFCGKPMSVEVMHGEKRTGTNGFYMAFFCSCAEWQFIETEIDIAHIQEI